MERKWLIILGAGVAVALVLSAVSVVGVAFMVFERRSDMEAPRVPVPVTPPGRGLPQASDNAGFTVTVQTSEYAWAAIPMKIVVITNPADTPLIVKRVSVNGGPPETRIYPTMAAAMHLGTFPGGVVKQVALPATLTIGKALFIASVVGDDEIIYVDTETDRGTFRRQMQ